MKKIIALVILVPLLSLSGCHSHEWVDADCVNPKTCSGCGDTIGESLGHSAPDLTCTEGALCVRCSSMVEAPGHTISPATCMEPEKCAVCGETYGEALGHEWADATCTKPISCTRCSETQGEALGHVWVEADCINSKTCSVCGEIEGSALGHDTPWQTCTTDAICLRCNENIPAPGHDMKAATCEEPSFCSVCGIKEGTFLGHTTNNGLCTRCNIEHYEKGMVPMREDHLHYESMSRMEAVAELENQGFKNIKLEAIYDVGTGLFEKLGDDKIESISIGGVSDFDDSGVYSENVEILIVYHTFTILDPSIEYKKITVAQLMDDLENNAMRAKETYLDTYVELTGRIENIDSNGKDFDLLPAYDQWAIFGIDCSVLTDEQKEHLKTLSSGNIIVVRGIITYVGELTFSLDVCGFK